ncbi:MAG: hypothetical protein Q9168_005482 [Polycauliona sp. 1 TL-2023]
MKFSGDYGPYLTTWFKRLDNKLDLTYERVKLADDGALSGVDSINSSVEAVQAFIESTEASVEHVQATVESTEANLEVRIGELEDSLVARMGELEEKIDDVDTVVATRLESTEESLVEKVDRLNKHTIKVLDTLDARTQRHLEDMRALHRNALCTQGWQRIEPVRSLSGRNALPRNYPGSVRSFWNLKDRSKSDALTVLLQYYDVEGYQSWDQEDSPGTPISSARPTVNVCLWPPTTLRSAVHDHPEIAHRALALELGLDYDKVQVCMEAKLVSARLEMERAMTPSDGSSGPSHRPSLPLDRRRHISAYGYTQAKALVYPKNGSPKDVLNLHTHSISPPHSNLITLRTLAAPLNPADINQIQGTYPTAPPFTQDLGTAQPSAVPGNEACFEVLSAGSGCKSVSKGDWVIPRRTGLGTWRTHLQVPEEKVMKINKEGLNPEQVATISVNPITAYRMLKDFTTLKEGDWFIQNGANSGVGRAAVQLGKMWGLKSICVVRKREGAVGEALYKEMQELGATVVVNDEEILEKGFGERVKEWTNGGRESLNLALNCVGGDAGMALAKTLGAGGTMVTYGAMSRSALRVGAGMLIFKDLRFVGFWVSKWGDRFPDEKEKTIAEVLGLIREGKFKDVPMVEVPWSYETKKEELLDAVQGTLDGFRKGKGIFKFGDT